MTLNSHAYTFERVTAKNLSYSVKILNNLDISKDIF